jgi:F-type H+-transporting ATPase subunit delta
MAELAVVRRYARALFDAADKSNAVDQVEEDLKGVHQVLAASPRLERTLRAPTLSGSRKKGLLATAFQNRVSPLSLRFLALLIDRQREDVLGDIYTEYQRLANERRNIEYVKVTSATPLTDEEFQALGNALVQRTGKRVSLEVTLDPSIMGGLILRMGDTVIDGSIRTRLEQLRTRLLAGQRA